MLEKNNVYDNEVLFTFLRTNNLSTNMEYYSDDELSMLQKEAKKDKKELEEKNKKENHKKMMNLLIKRKVIDHLRIPGEYIQSIGVDGFRIIGNFDPEKYLIENGFDPICMSIENHAIDIVTHDLVCFIKMRN